MTNLDGVLVNDSRERLNEEAALLSGPSHAKTFILEPDGGYRWIPEDGYFGGDSFRYTLRSGASGQCTAGDATVTIPPMTLGRLVDDEYEVLAGREFNTGSVIGGGVFQHFPDVRANDINLAGTSVFTLQGNVLGLGVPITLFSLTDPTVVAGELRLQDDGHFRFVPAPGFVGSTQFRYVTGLHDDISTHPGERGARVTINVVAPPFPTGFFSPVAIDDHFAIEEDSPVMIMAGDLLLNDARASLVFDPHSAQHGSLQVDRCTNEEVQATQCLPLNSVQSVTYTPHPDYHGPDSFTYQAVSTSPESVGMATGTVFIDVNPLVDPPQAVNDTFSAARAEPTVLRVLDNDIDPDKRIDPTSVALEFFPAGGAAGVILPQDDGTFLYTPDGSVSQKTFSYRFLDIDGYPAQANFTVNVAANPAANDSYTMDEDAILSVPAPGILANDSGPFTGLSGSGPSANLGSVTLRPDGSFTYRPRLQFVGTDTFTYFLDGEPATVTITVNPVDDAPGIFLNVASCPEGEVCPHNPDPDGRDSIHPGELVRLRGFVFDAERHQGNIVVDWGDGETTTTTYPCVIGVVLDCPYREAQTQTWFTTLTGLCGPVFCSEVLFFEFNHVYDGAPPPGGGSQYTITVTATQFDGGSGSDTETATLADTDTDDDGVNDVFDNCPADMNPDQTDLDGDGTGDPCDPDDDNDTVLDASDNCPAVANTDQADLDGDAAGDLCDTDDDGDTLADQDDNCPALANADQADADSDGAGDACDDDLDGDTIANAADNCPTDANSDQADNDGDGPGDACDVDDDNDEWKDPSDNCSVVANADQADTDGDGAGDACDDDLDGDTIANATDNCPANANVDQANNDGDGAGDACDVDDDNDGQKDPSDNCPAVPNADQADNDGDEAGDACDDDDDGDGLPDPSDVCPLNAPAGARDADINGCTDSVSGLGVLVQDIAPGRLRTSLLNSLTAIKRSIDRDLDRVARVQLGVFIIQVEIASGRTLTVQQADLLASYARNIIAGL